MPAALHARAVDAVTSGEPYMGQTELEGFGRVLYLTKDVWPNFISCVLAVTEGTIRDRPEVVQDLVTGIARSGHWLDQSTQHRMQAAEFVSKYYFNQHPKLLQYVLSKPPDRVKYTTLELYRDEFKEIEKLAQQAGILRGNVTFDEYADPSFISAVPGSAWEYEHPGVVAQGRTP
jgi:NitT/TauT family transport system substrate-binding protein